MISHNDLMCQVDSVNATITFPNGEVLVRPFYRCLRGLRNSANQRPINFSLPLKALQFENEEQEYAFKERITHEILPAMDANYHYNYDEVQTEPLVLLERI